MQNRRTSGLNGYHNGFLAFIVCLVLVGALLGAVTYGYMDVSFADKLAQLQSGYLDVRKNSDFVQVLLRSFSSSMIFLGTVFVLGFSAVAQPLELAVPLVKGIGVGAAMAQVYSSQGMSGISSCALLIVPSAVISVYALAVGTREAVMMSNQLFGVMLSDNSTSAMLNKTKLYGTRFLVLASVNAVSAAVDCLCTLIFL